MTQSLGPWRRLGVLAVVVATPLLAVLLSLAGNAASESKPWPAPLDLIERNPWLSLVVGVVLAALLDSAGRLASLRARAEATPDDLQRAADDVARLVRNEVDAERGNRMLGTPIDLSVLPHSRDQGHSRISQLADLIGIARGTHCRLAVVGGAGSGKSTALFNLADQLLDGRVPTAPVPVLVNLAAWDPNEERVDDFVRRRLSGRSRSTRQHRRRWFRLWRRRAATEPVDLVNSGRVLPMFDGLDEIPRDRWDKARDGLRVALGAGDRQFVLASRPDAFDLIIPDEILARGRTNVVEIRPVSTTSAITYLAGPDRPIRGRWRRLAETLQSAQLPVPPVAAALASPLMLYLTRKVYERPSTAPGLLCEPRFGTKESIEAHLLGSYVAAMYASPETSESMDMRSPAPFDSDTAYRWLSGIARLLDRNQGDVLQWWNLSASLPDPRRWEPRVSWLGVVLLTVFGVVGAIAAPAVGSLLWGGLSAAMSWIQSLRPLLIDSARAQSQTPVQAWTNLIYDPALLAALDSLFGGPDALLATSVIGAAGGLFLSLWFMLTGEPPGADGMTSARGSFRADRNLALSSALVAGLAMAATVYWLQGPVWRWFALEMSPVLASSGVLPVELVDSWRSAVPHPEGFWGWIFPTVGATTSALAVLGVSASFRLRLHTPWLAAVHHLPGDVFTFMEDASRRGVLRRYGTGYVFRHDLVKRYLADPVLAGMSVEQVIRRAKTLALVGDRKKARRLLESIVPYAPRARIALAALHLRWAERFRTPVLRDLYLGHLSSATRLWVQAIIEGDDAAFRHSVRILDNRLNRLSEDRLGFFLKRYFLEEARRFWFRVGEHLDSTQRRFLIDSIAGQVTRLDRWPPVRWQQIEIRRELRRLRQLPNVGPASPSDPGWWEALHLSEPVELALRLASAEGQGLPVQTGSLLVALSEADFSGSADWVQLWIGLGFSDFDGLKRAPDTRSAAISRPLPIGLSGFTIPVSEDLHSAMRNLASLAVRHDLRTIHPGAVGLALVSVASGGATRMLCAYTHIDQSELWTRMDDDILGGGIGPLPARLR